MKFPSKFKMFFVLAVCFLIAPKVAMPCACGCGVFDVGTSSMLPSGSGGMAYLGYNYQDQNQNWNSTSKATADSNEDKEIQTHSVTLGLQYMFNRSWGIQAEAPYISRSFKAENDSGEVVSADYSGLGDIRIRGMFTGFSEDLSIGVSLGLKLPTASHTQHSDLLDIDRDTQIGSGSTDILVGAYYRRALTQGNHWSGFLQAQWDQPVFSQDGYTPGAEWDESIGLHYNGLSLGSIRIKPVAQIIGSERAGDTGPSAASPVASGYTRILLAPGIEFHFHPVKFYADIELPVYETVTGNQLVAPALFKVSLSSMF